MTTGGFWTYENRLVTILAAAGGVAGLDVLALNFLAPFVAVDLHLSNTQIGLIGAAAILSWAVSGWVAAFASDRLGMRKPFMVWVFVLFALFSTASAFAYSAGFLLLTRVLIGLTEGPVIPIMQSVMVAESSVHRRGLNMGIVQNFGSQLIGALISPLLLVWLATRFSWRAAFLLAGLPGVVMAFIIMRFVREPPRPETKGFAADTLTLSATLRDILAQRNVVLCVIIGGFAGAWFAVTLAFLPLWSVRTMGLSPGTMSVIMSCLGAAGAISAALVPWLSDRIGRRPAIILFPLCGAVGPLLLLFLAHGAVAISCVVFLSSFIMGIFPLFIAVVPIESVQPRHAAMASATAMGGSQVLGFSGPLIAGMLADHFSLNAALWMMAGLGLLASLTGFALTETAPLKVMQVRDSALLTLPKAVEL